jgi:hypothetical protein
MPLSAIAPTPILVPTGNNQNQACPEWRVFVEQYTQAALNLSEAVQALPVEPGLEFNRAWERVERALKDCDGARSALLRHEHRHDCASQHQPRVG